jgi:hypothetical protein
VRIVRLWFEDIFTRGDLSVVDDILADDFAAHGPGDHSDSHGMEAFRTGSAGTARASRIQSGRSTTLSPLGTRS